VKIISEANFERIRNGDTKPLAEIYTANKDYIIQNLIRFYGCEKHDAEDFTHDAIIVLLEKIISNEYENKNVRAFLFKVAENKMRNKFRKDGQTIPINPSDLPETPNSEIMKDENEYNEKMAKEVIAYIQSLSEPCKSILHMILVQGISDDFVFDTLPYESKAVFHQTKYRCMEKLRNNIELK